MKGGRVYRMAHSVVVVMAVIPALREWLFSSTGFLGGLFPTPLYHLGGLFQTPLYHLHPCRRASMQAGLRRNDGRGWRSGIRQA